MVTPGSFFRAIASVSTGALLVVAVAQPALQADEARRAVTEAAARASDEAERLDDFELRAALARWETRRLVEEFDRHERAEQPLIGDFAPPGQLRRD